MLASMRMPHQALRLLQVGVLLACCFLSSVGQFISVEECPLTPACCEEDCCGQGTSWDSDVEYCVVSQGSEGYTGTHSSDWEEGCILRACCGANCCSQGTTFDEDISFCIPSETSEQPNQKDIGEKCENSSDCVSGSCFQAISALDGICTCNPEDNFGCDGDLVCSFPENAFYLVPPPPACYLPVGAPCEQDSELVCVSGNCNQATDTCGCSTVTDSPCDIDNGERCAFDSTEGFVCQLPGDGSLGSKCLSNSDCDSNSCSFSPILPPGSPGSCSCNTETNAGCEGDFVCVSPGDITEALGIQDIGPTCFLASLGAECNENSDCLTGNCIGNECVCSDLTNYPCDTSIGESCVPQGDTLVCKAPDVGDGATGSPCFSDDECDTDTCAFENAGPGAPGFCSCNSDTGLGCDEGFVCYTAGEYGEARGVLITTSNRCLLPVGSKCTDDRSCLTENCDDFSNECACNPFTSFGCKDGEKCVVQGGSSICTEGSTGSPCFFDEDCENEICAFENAGPGSPGFCSCNSDTRAGCEDGFVCYTAEEYASAQGFAITTSNSCLLPLGSACDPQRTECLSAACDKVTNLCACNSFTNFGCDAENGEVCNIRDGLYVCEVPITSPGAVGDDCFEDDDCETLSCVFDPPAPGSPGRCSCNSTTQEGCEGEYFCATPGDIGAAVGAVVSVSPFCKLPVGAICDPDENDCLTGECDVSTNTCSCNSVTNFPCDVENRETCALDSNGSFICQVVNTGDGSTGSPCFSNDDCDNNVCAFENAGPGTPGLCSCNSDTGLGCDEGFVCYTAEEYASAQGFAVTTSNRCYLPFGAECTDDGSCLTDNCNKDTNLCTCNGFSGFGCDSDAGEICAREDGQSLCKVPNNEPIGNNCIDDSDCESGTCFYGFQPPGTPGTCACNADTNFGCTGDEVCATPNDLTEAQNVADASQGCYLPFGATCTPGEFNCITGNCDVETNTCGCNELSNFPCDTSAGQVCINNNGSFSCEASVACPVCNGFCTLEFAPVNCSGCEYSNQCFATCAGFSPDKCTDVQPRLPGTRLRH